MLLSRAAFLSTSRFSHFRMYAASQEMRKGNPSPHILSSAKRSSEFRVVSKPSRSLPSSSITNDGESELASPPKKFLQLKLMLPVARSLISLNWQQPTPVQERAIPLAIRSKNVRFSSFCITYEESSLRPSIVSLFRSLRPRKLALERQQHTFYQCFIVFTFSFSGSAASVCSLIFIVCSHLRSIHW